MKYIKQYENKKSKKFLVIDTEKYIYVIEILRKVDEKKYDVKIYRMYNKNNYKVEEIPISVSRLDDLDFPILLKSDNLQDCLEYIETIRKANKYNL